MAAPAATSSASAPRTIQTARLWSLLVRPARGGVVVGAGVVEVGAIVVLVVEVVVDATVVAGAVGVVGWVTWSVAEIPTVPPPQRTPML